MSAQRTAGNETRAHGLIGRWRKSIRPSAEPYAQNQDCLTSRLAWCLNGQSFAPGWREVLTTMKIALLGPGFGQAHAAVYAQRSDVDEVIVFGRTAEKLAKIGGEFGFATSTDLDRLIADSSVDLVDICLPTLLHADVAIRAMQAGKAVLIELPLAATLDDARRVVAARQATG